MKIPTHSNRSREKGGERRKGSGNVVRGKEKGKFVYCFGIYHFLGPPLGGGRLKLYVGLQG